MRLQIKTIYFYTANDNDCEFLSIFNLKRNAQRSKKCGSGRHTWLSVNDDQITMVTCNSCPYRRMYTASVAISF